MTTEEATGTAGARPRGDIVVDATGLLCPMPIVHLAQGMRQARVGQVVEVTATDMGILEDAPAWAATTRHEIVGRLIEGDRYTFWFRKLHD
ncbi:MAG TPA: sulfurtransferase TusA family protein [Candidatus Limnocylindrales bacterium]|nr:sulfurtransferase TusA family protein [Candidatus Limnocylindrales bacterium]